MFWRGDPLAGKKKDEAWGEEREQTSRGPSPNLGRFLPLLLSFVCTRRTHACTSISLQLHHSRRREPEHCQLTGEAAYGQRDHERPCREEPESFIWGQVFSESDSAASRLQLPPKNLSMVTQSRYYNINKGSKKYQYTSIT